MHISRAKNKKASILIDVESLAKSAEFKKLLGTLIQIKIHRKRG